MTPKKKEILFFILSLILFGIALWNIFFMVELFFSRRGGGASFQGGMALIVPFFIHSGTFIFSLLINLILLKIIHKYNAAPLTKTSLKIVLFMNLAMLVTFLIKVVVYQMKLS